MQQIRRLVRHQKLRAVRRAQNQRPRRAQPRHHHRILARNLALVQQAANLAPVPRRGNRRLHRHRQPVQRPARLLLAASSRRACSRTRSASKSANAFSSGFSRSICANVRLGQFRHRNLARAQQFQLPRRRLQHNIVHAASHSAAQPSAPPQASGQLGQHRPSASKAAPGSRTGTTAPARPCRSDHSSSTDNRAHPHRPETSRSPDTDTLLILWNGSCATVNGDASHQSMSFTYPLA